MCVCHFLPRGAIPRAEAGAGEAAITGPVISQLRLGNSQFMCLLRGCMKSVCAGYGNNHIHGSNIM